MAAPRGTKRGRGPHLPAIALGEDLAAALGAVLDRLAERRPWSNVALSSFVRWALWEAIARVNEELNRADQAQLSLPITDRDVPLFEALPRGRASPVQQQRWAEREDTTGKTRTKTGTTKKTATKTRRP